LLAVQAVGRLLPLFCKLHSQLCARTAEQPHSLVVRMQTCMAAAEQLAKSGIEATVMDARFCKPLDESLIRQLAQKHPVRIVLFMPQS
jgi:predicted kinase